MRDELQQLPAIGPSMARDLRRLGVRSAKDLARRDPERVYARLCAIKGERQDACTHEPARRGLGDGGAGVA